MWGKVKEKREGGKVMIVVTEKLIVIWEEGQPQSYFLKVQGVRNLHGKRRPWSTLATNVGKASWKGQCRKDVNCCCCF